MPVAVRKPWRPNASRMKHSIGVPLQLNSLHDFRLALGDRSVVVKARVVHSHISTVASVVVSYHTGIEFVDVSEPIANVLATFIDTLKRQRTPAR